MKKLLRFLLCLTILTAPIYGANYLLLSDVGVSAQTIGRGNIGGFDYSANGVFENPATLQHVPDMSFAFFKTKFIGELNISTFMASKTIGKHSFGLGYLNGSVKELYATSLTPKSVIIETGTFDYADTQIKGSYARHLQGNYTFGSTFSQYSKRIGTYTAKGFGVDLGIHHIGQTIETSFVIQNIFKTQATYSNNTSELIPRQMILSGKYLWSYFAFLGQINAYQGVGVLKSIGIEAEVPKIPYIKLLAGRKEFPVLGKKKSSMSLGIALNMFGLSVNYAFEKSDHVEFNYKHYASISINYDRIWKKRGALQVSQKGVEN